MKAALVVLFVVLLIACVSARWVWSEEEAQMATETLAEELPYDTPVEEEVPQTFVESQEGQAVSVLEAQPEFFNAIRDAISKVTDAFKAPQPTDTTIPVDKLRGIIDNYTPIVYIPKKEQYNPVAIEWVTSFAGVTDAQLNDVNYRLPYTLKEAPFRNNAPVYVSVKTVASEIWISYSILQSYNGCGPEMSVTATVCGAGINDKRISLCPGGVHNGDFEHITVAVEALPAGSTAMPKVKRVYVAYHSYGNWHQPADIQWEGSHPRIFMAVGSHASYTKPGPQFYHKVWDEKASTPCPAICKKWGIPYPCVSSKDAITKGYFVDFAPQINDAHRWSPAARLLAIDGKPISGISTPELKMVQLKGRFGLKIVNDSWNKFKNTVLDLTWPIRKISGSVDNKIKGGLNSADGEMQSEAPTSLGSKGYYSKNTEA